MSGVKGPTVKSLKLISSARVRATHPVLQTASLESNNDNNLEQMRFRVRRSGDRPLVGSDPIDCQSSRQQPLGIGDRVLDAAAASNLSTLHAVNSPDQADKGVVGINHPRLRICRQPREQASRTKQVRFPLKIPQHLQRQR